MSDFWSNCRLIKPLSRGGYSKVYSILLPKDQIFAFKLQKFNEQEGLPAWILNEINLLGITHHITEIINLNGIEYRKNNFGLIFPQYPESLRSFIRHQTFDRRNYYVWDLIKTCVCAVAKLDQLNYYHLDLKPDNIVITDSVNPKFKIIDLGMGLSKSAYLRSKRNHQTLWYRAPEFVYNRDKSEFSPVQSEIWTIGLVILEYLTKYPIFLINEAAQFRHGYVELIKNIDKSPDFPNIGIYEEKFWEFGCQFGKLSGKINVEKYLSESLVDNYFKLDPKVVKLCKQMLDINPNKRITIQGLLNKLEINLEPIPTPEFNFCPLSESIESDMNLLSIKYQIDQTSCLLAKNILARYMSANNNSSPDSIFKIIGFKIACYLRGIRIPIKIIEDCQQSIIQAECELINSLNYILYPPNLMKIIEIKQ